MKQFAIMTVVALALVGCGKNESGTVADETKKATEAAASSVSKTVEAAKDQVKDAAASATSQAQEWIDKAKTLVAEKKFTDASSVVEKLGGLKLSAEQQAAVESLKEQIKKAIAGAASKDGASAVGDLLKK